MRIVIATCLLLLLMTPPVLAKEMSPHRHGYEQGKAAGRREGRERVGDRSYYQGERDGYAAGSLEGQRQLIDEARAQGLSLGQTEGSSQGRQEGQENGLEQGRAEGGEQGEVKARESADAAARNAVTSRAEKDGRTRALLATPEADGKRSGTEAGFERAQKVANEKDFSRARDDYRNRQFSTPAKSKTEVRQAPLAIEPGNWLLPHPSEVVFGRVSCPAPDWRYLRYGSDNEEYQRGYRQGYTEGMRDGFEERYEREYRHGYDHAYALGISQARVGNLQSTVDEAYQQGFAQAHESAFRQAYKQAHQEAFQPAFEAAYAYTYAKLYPEFEKEHYATIEETTFQSLYNPPYQAAFQKFEEESFTENYPKQAKLAYDQGWIAEAKDFSERPVRLLEAWRTPTDVEGVQLLTVKLRNFSSQTVAGSRVRVSFGPQTSRLYHPLPPESEVTVTGLLRLRGDQPEQAELFAVIDNDGKRLPLGTLNVTTAPSQP